jgi:hypothetical protein
LRHPRWPIGDRLGARVGRGTPKPVRAPTLGMSANPAPEKIPGCLYPSSRLAPQRRVRIRVDKLRARGVVVREGQADIAIVIEKARAANSLRALTGEERNSSRSRRAHDGHRFESPQLHHEVRANRRDFLRHRIARHFRSLPRRGTVSAGVRRFSGAITGASRRKSLAAKFRFQGCCLLRVHRARFRMGVRT